MSTLSTVEFLKSRLLGVYFKALLNRSLLSDDLLYVKETPLR